MINRDIATAFDTEPAQNAGAVAKLGLSDMDLLVVETVGKLVAEIDVPDIN